MAFVIHELSTDGSVWGFRIVIVRVLEVMLTDKIFVKFIRKYRMHETICITV